MCMLSYLKVIIFKGIAESTGLSNFKTNVKILIDTINRNGVKKVPNVQSIKIMIAQTGEY